MSGILLLKLNATIEHNELPILGKTLLNMIVTIQYMWCRIGDVSCCKSICHTTIFCERSPTDNHC